MPSSVPQWNMGVRSPFSDDVQNFISSVSEHFHLPSVSVGTIRGTDVYTHVGDLGSHQALCFGYILLTFVQVIGNAKGGREPTKATEDTLYCLASLTKSFTAASLLSVL